MSKTKKRVNLVLLLIFFALCKNASFAQYEIVRAKTVGNEAIEEPLEVNQTSTFNDPSVPLLPEQDCIGAILQQKAKGFFKKKKNKTFQNEELSNSELNNETVKDNNDDGSFIDAKKYNEPVVDNKNKFQINADKITYDDEEGNVYAKGHVEIISKEQGVTLKADDAVLDKPSQTIKLHNNVKIIKDGTEMRGEYLVIDLNEQNILMDEPTTVAYSFVIKAQEGYLIANDIQMLNGTIKSEKNTQVALETRGFQTYENITYNFRRLGAMEREIDQSKKQVYTINAKEIVLTSYKDHNSLKLKDSDIYYGKRKVINGTDIEIISDKQNQVVETNSPEGGNLRAFGMYIGYGYALRLPHGQTLKLLPALTYGDSNIGVGLIAKHRSKRSYLEAGYSTSTTNLVARGRYKFNNNLSFRYGRQAYIPEGFLGARRSGYAAQLEYTKSFYMPDLDISLNHGVYGGFFSDYKKSHQEEAYATTRFRYMAQAIKPLLKYENKEQDLSITLSGRAEAAATLYGSGQTTGVARIGPFLSTKVRRWESSIGYLISGVHGDSPFWFDKYMYGKSSVMLNEKFNFNNKFALGYRATVTPLKDNYQDELLTESRFYAIFGPQDLKMVISYDFIRDIAHFDFMFLLGSDSSKINFEKLTTQNMDGSKNKKDFYKNAKPVKIEKPENI